MLKYVFGQWNREGFKNKIPRNQIIMQNIYLTMLK